MTGARRARQRLRATAWGMVPRCMRSSLLPLALLGLAACQPPPARTGAKVSEFALTDVNPSSPRSGQPVAPHDYAGKVSAWYFGHST